jgi:metal iron transporter
MVVIISKVNVNWADAFQGYLPSKYIFKSGGLYTCMSPFLGLISTSSLTRSAVGILGATVMPHSLFLGSALATQDRIEFKPKDPDELTLTPNQSKESQETAVVHSVTARSRVSSLFNTLKESVANAFRKPRPSSFTTRVLRHSDHQNNSFEFIHAHLSHGVLDMVGSLLGFAVIINSLYVKPIVVGFRQLIQRRILILAAAVFYRGNSSFEGPASLFDAYDLIRELVGKRL